MSVVQFQPRGQRQPTVIQALRDMLAMAEVGDLDGFGACRRHRNGDETIVLAGYFESNPDEALRACLDASIILNQIRDAAQTRDGTAGC